MKMNVDQPIFDLDGNTIPVPHTMRQAVAAVREMLDDPARLEEAKASLDGMIQATTPLTFRKVAMDALMATLPGEERQPQDGQTKFKMWNLALKINKGGEVEIDTGDEVALLKERIGKGFGPLVVGPAYLMLNGTGPSKG